MDRAHQLPPTTSGQAKTRWRSFGEKSSLSSLLSQAQYGLCAYSELDLNDANFGAHIEHVKPKSKYPNLTFDYQNLVLCAQSSEDLKGLIVGDHFGGHAKLSKYDPHQFISCLDSGCEGYFVYLSDGRVVPREEALASAEYAKAVYTISLLNLNAPSLVVERKRWLEELDALIDQHLDNDYSLTCLAEVDLVPINNRLRPFFSATRQRYSGVAEAVLKKEAPELL